ncbi:unnamed protein product [Didymodactylos carnosus]|uniref:Uncharacterized protein n=1 Tax=Didymodactylos carnosus TaxID=1234261 RepID=A0A8S2SB46_9BILA|nr:unnamed protein product [Didymodactylos carnosus]CAF4210499.1 unnamed protein product [Didymodactylos carnosus]
MRREIIMKKRKYIEQRLRIVYNDKSRLLLHVSNLIISTFAFKLTSQLSNSSLLRLTFPLISYLLIGKLLLNKGNEMIGILESLCTSLTAGSYIYGNYGHYLSVTIVIAFITYVSTSAIGLPILYRCIQTLLLPIHPSFINEFESILDQLFNYSWSYFGMIWTLMKRCHQKILLNLLVPVEQFWLQAYESISVGLTAFTR